MLHTVTSYYEICFYASVFTACLKIEINHRRICDMRKERKSVKERLKVAYISLLCKKKNADITVTELVREADVSRVSYYRSFSSFDDILDECISDAYKYITDILAPHIFEDKKKAWKELIVGFLTDLKSNSLPIPLMVSDNAPLIMSKANEKLSSFFNDRSISSEEKYTTSANLAMLAGVGGRWAKGGFREPIEEIAEFTFRLVESNLEVCREGNMIVQ